MDAGGNLSSLRISRSTLGSARKRVERKRDETKVRRGGYVSVDATLAPNVLNRIKQTRPPPLWRPTAYNIFQSRPSLRSSFSSQTFLPFPTPSLPFLPHTHTLRLIIFYPLPGHPARCMDDGNLVSFVI